MHSLRRAFTLIELLVVILIIGLLTGVATTSFLNAQRNSRDSARKSNVNAIAGAVEAYRTAKGKYPGAATQTGGLPAAIDGCVAAVGTNLVYYYMPMENNSCTSKATGLASPHSPADFAPAPNWIPGLAAYLNPPATEKSYLGKDGHEDSNPSFSSNGSPTSTDGTTNDTRTFSYNKTTNGYNIFAKLENTPCDSAVTPDPCLYSVQK